jgi:hypothetical protein
MAPTPVRFVPESPGIAPQTVTQESQRRPISRYAGRGRSSRSLRSLETRGTASCCIRSKSSRFVVHSFREGNTRTQFVFFSQLCEQAGHRLDTEAFRPGNPLRDEFVQARFHGQDTGSNDRLAEVLGRAIATPSDPGSSVGPSPGLREPMGVRELSFPRTAGKRPANPASVQPGRAARAEPDRSHQRPSSRGQAAGYYTDRGGPGIGR